MHVIVQQHTSFNAEKALFMATFTRKRSVLSEDQEGAMSLDNRQQTEFISTFIVNNTQQKKKQTKNKKRDDRHIIYHNR